MDKSCVNQPTDDNTPKSNTTYVKTDVTELLDELRVISKSNSESANELSKLTKLYHTMFADTIQKQNDELESYRRGALKQSVVDILREVAKIYSDNLYNLNNLTEPMDLLHHVASLLEELLSDRGVEIIVSKEGDSFNRKCARTYEEYTITTEDLSKDRVIAETVYPGFLMLGETLLQETVKLYKYVHQDVLMSTPDVSSDIPNEEENTTVEDSNCSEIINKQLEVDAEQTTNREDVINA